jgi:hypothetical protein
MDDNNELSASVVRNLDVVEAATRHLAVVERRLLGVIMTYLDSVCADIGWRLVGRDADADDAGFGYNSFFPPSWAIDDHEESADFLFEICAEGPDCGDLNWITCLTRAMGNDGETVIQANFQKFLGKPKNKKFLARPDIRDAIAALGFENNGVEVQRRFVIDRELLAKAFDDDDGEDINAGFREALAPLGSDVREIARQFKGWDALRVKAVSFANE